MKKDTNELGYMTKMADMSLYSGKRLEIFALNWL